MKPDAGQVARLLAAPVRLRAILLHGDDHGLIRERASEAARAAAGGLEDPFRVAILGREAHDRLEEEATALSLSGGRRVVWLREAQDTLHGTVTRLIGGPARSADPGEGALIVIEAPGLASRSKLRAAIEAAADAASIACYAEEGRALEASLARMLEVARVRIDPDALTWLAQRLGADRAASRGEVEKLVLYAGDEGRITLDDVQAVTGDAASASLEDAAFAATAGDRPGADLAIERALSEGSSPIALARVLLSHLHRLRQVLLLIEGGGSASDAMRGLRPPVFFKRQGQFTRALSLWSAASLFEAAVETNRLELACKRTGAPDLALARRHVAWLASRAAARARPR